MVKLTLLFRQPADEASFETRYNENLMLLEKLPGLRRRQACVVLGSPSGKSSYYRLLEFYFDDFRTLDAAMLSAEGRIAGSDLMSFAAQYVDLIFSEVFEE